MNYGQIKDTILLTLDLPLGMTGDISDLVDLKIQEIANEIIGDYKPKELLVKVGPVAITNGDDEIPVGVGGFGVTDMVIPYGITLGDYTDYADNRDEKFLPYISYEAWIQLNSYKLGNERPSNSFTIDLDGNIILQSYPDGTASWDIYFWYYREITAYSALVEPELPEYYRAVISTGVILEFPQFFKTQERLALYQRLVTRHDNLMKKLHSLKGFGKKFMNMKSRTTRGGSRSNLWPRSPLTS
jgi:hypothetical protein